MCFGRQKRVEIPPVAPAVPPPAPVQQVVGRSASLKKRTYSKRPSLRRKSNIQQRRSLRRQEPVQASSNTPY